jgi:anthranilate phosphoribosyltransferase
VDSKRDIVLLNSGLALYAAGKTSSIKEGVELAKELIDSKKALEKLNALIEFTNR